jgi:hypothetical protein
MVANHVRVSTGLKISAHSFRATFYLWFVLGGGSMHLTKRNARHSSFTECEKYYRESEGVLEWIRNHPALIHVMAVAPARDLVDHQGGIQFQRLNEMVGSQQACTLSQAAKSFVENMLGVSPSDSRYRNPEHLLNMSYGISFSGRNPQKDLSTALDKLPNELKHEIQVAVELHITSVIKSLSDSRSAGPPPSGDFSPLRAPHGFFASPASNIGNSTRTHQHQHTQPSVLGVPRLEVLEIS